MAKQEPERDIGGRRFRFGMLDCETSFDVFTVLVKNLGEGLVKAFATTDNGAFLPLSDDAPASLKAAKEEAQTRLGTQLIGAIARGFNSGEMKDAIRKLLSVTACLDQKPKGTCEMNLTFNGRLLEMFQVVLEAIKVNYADFLAVFLSTLSPVPTPE